MNRSFLSEKHLKNQIQKFVVIIQHPILQKMNVHGGVETSHTMETLEIYPMGCRHKV